MLLDLPFQSLGIAKGVCYLHDNNIVHADIKAVSKLTVRDAYVVVETILQDNVLVSPSGEPILANFGLSRMAESLWSKGFYTTEASRLSTRWLPHEYYYVRENEKFNPSPKSDVWAFGMTVLVRSSINV